MSAHVPAWKRLGLKLKGPPSGEAIPSSVGPNSRVKPSAQTPNAHQTRANGSPASALKRKQPTSASSTPNAASAQTPNKKPRREDQSAADQGTPSSLRKSVSFAGDTKDSTKEKAGPKKTKSKKAKKAISTTKSDFSLEPSLNYIRQWHTARETWKFNKNHQTLLIKYLFDGDKVPSADIPIFYQYIRDLKGFVRTRLRETAAELKKKDMEAGAGAFPAALKDKEAKQREYEETISRFLQDLQQHQQRRQAHNKSKNVNGKRTLDEVEYVLRVATPEIKQRLLKRIRAELVADELSASEEGEESSSTSAASAATPTGTTSSSSASSSGRDAVVAATAARTGRSDGSQQPAKRRRLRNVRTAIDDDDSSSSESESGESGSAEGSSRSSSESESDSEDEVMDMAPGGAATESSSSSSSSSESEGESEADSETEGASESSGSGASDDD